MYSFIYGYFKFSELEDFEKGMIYMSLFPVMIFAILAFHFKLKLNKIVHLFRLENTKKRLEVSFFSLLFFVILSMVIPSLLFFLWFVIKGEPIRIFYIEYTIYYAISALLIGPITEEIFFRRFIAHQLFRKYGFIKAVIYSASLFSLAHLPSEISQLLVFFGGGVLLAYLYLKTRNVYMVILVHSLSNLNEILNGYYPHFIAMGLNNIYKEIPYFWIYYTLCFFGLIFLARVSYRYINNYYKLYVFEE